MERDLLICSPHDYYLVLNQDNISRLCARDNRQWIYELISTGMSAHDEVVMTETAQWLLCLDKHPGEDTRYLVVFHELALKTIRDLRGQHVPMLLEMLASVRAEMLVRHPEWAGCQVYFHYYPSVYQLHAHVCEDSVLSSARKASCRCHEVGHVVRNLRTDSLWYTKALILTNRPKHVFRATARACRVVMSRESSRWETVLRRV